MTHLRAWNRTPAARIAGAVLAGVGMVALDVTGHVDLAIYIGGACGTLLIWQQYRRSHQ